MPDDATPLVRFEAVEKTYPGTAAPAVADLHLDVRRGELLTLLGPSGSGKTTTLMMLAGFEAPTRGRILLDGRDVSRTPPQARGIGVVFQSYALFPHMSALDNVAFPLEARGVPRAERRRRAMEALATVRLDAAMAGRRPGALSGGQQQRVALARALVFGPPVVLLDEPMGALDKALREEVGREIRRVQREAGATMLVVTHDQSEALALSDRVAVMEGGRLRQVGPPRALYDEPADAFVAGFVGENNRLPGVVVASEDGEVRVRLDGTPGTEAEARAGALAVGARCVLMVRPERVAVAAVSARDLGEGATAARLLDATFGGDHVRLRLALGEDGGGPVLVAKRAVGGGPLPTPGGAASVAWDASHARAFALGSGDGGLPPA